MAEEIKQLDLHADPLSLRQIRINNNENYKKINENFSAAKGLVSNIQSQVNKLAVEGAIDPLTRQALVDGEGNTYDSLQQRLNKADSELAEKASKAEARLKSVKLELEDMSETTLGAMSGNATFSLLSIPQKGSVSYEKTDFLNVGKNLFDYTKTTDGYYPSPTTGVLTAAPDHSVSDWIPVLPNRDIALNNLAGGSYIAFYDSNKTFISGLKLSTVSIKTPANTAYLRFTCKITMFNKNTYQLEYGTASTTFEAFGIFGNIVNSQQHQKYHEADAGNELKANFSLYNLIFDDPKLLTKGEFTGGITAVREQHKDIESFKTFNQLHLNFTSTTSLQGAKVKFKYTLADKGFVAGDYIQYSFLTTDINFSNYTYYQLLLLNASGSPTREVFDLENGYYLVHGYYQITSADVTNNISVDELDVLSKASGQVINTVILAPMVFVNRKKLNIYKLINKVLQDLNKTNTPTSKWVGKKSAHMGDSLTAANKYPAFLKSKLGLSEAYNLGVAGTTLASWVDRYTDVPQDSNVITIMGGTNDFSQGVLLGAIDTTDTTTYRGALRFLIEKYSTEYPNARLILMTPPQRWNEKVQPDPTTGLSVIDYANVVKEMAYKYGIPVVDMYGELGVNQFNISQYATDGVHFNDNIYERMADLIANCMNKLTVQ